MNPTTCTAFTLQSNHFVYNQETCGNFLQFPRGRDTSTHVISRNLWGCQRDMVMVMFVGVALFKQD